MTLRAVPVVERGQRDLALVLHVTGGARGAEGLRVVVSGSAVTRGAGPVGHSQEKASVVRPLSVGVGRTVALRARGSEHRVRGRHRPTRVETGITERRVPDEAATGDDGSRDGEHQLPATERVRVLEVGKLDPLGPDLGRVALVVHGGLVPDAHDRVDGRQQEQRHRERDVDQEPAVQPVVQPLLQRELAPLLADDAKLVHDLVQ